MKTTVLQSNNPDQQDSLETCDTERKSVLPNPIDTSEVDDVRIDRLSVSNIPAEGECEALETIKVHGLAPYPKGLLAHEPWFAWSGDGHETNQRTAKQINECLALRACKQRGGEDRDIPHQFVITQALERYFSIIEGVIDDFKLNEEEFNLLLNSTPQLYWDTNHRLVDRVLDAAGVENFDALNKNSSLVKLSYKLANLTQVQDIALTDFCEQAWRSSERMQIFREKFCS